MATIAADVPPFPPLSAEVDPSAVSPPQQLTNHPLDTPQSEELQLQDLVPALPSPPSFINSIGELKDLSSAISAFHQCYDDLHNHLDSIKAAILSKLPRETQYAIQLAPSSLPETKGAEEIVSQEQQEEPNPPKSELEGLSRTMCSRGIRRYLASNLSHLSELREEVPRALKLAPNPPKLVLECLGKFFLQGSKAFTRNSPMIPAREASISILECFLLMMGTDSTDGKDNGGMEIEKAVREEAESSALAWRKRLVLEGGVAKASQIDARGLLLFVSCFGIPDVFKMEDIRDLMIAANTKEIVSVLQKSHLLMNKIPEIVEGMIKKKMEVDAVDIVYTFGLEERFNPQTVLISFLRESKESWKKPKKGSQGSTASVNDANKKQLSVLKSISKCLEKHKIDPAKLLPGWQINEKIANLQKDTSDFNKKSSEKVGHNKRKANETESSRKSKMQEPKRSRYISHGLQHKASGPLDSRRHLLDTHHASNYTSAPSVVYGGPGAGLLPESMISAGVGPGKSVNLVGLSSYGGVRGGVLVDTSGQVVINRGTHSYARHGASALTERYTSHAQPSSLGLTSLYRASEGFAGVPNASSIGHGSRSSSSDLYQFADSVVESETYVPRSVAAVPAHHSSYLYQV